jgi:predicted  nucleic acid-binding Zn-ribbon protein
MNTTTKVFIVINLLMALGFAYLLMMWYAIGENYKRRWDKDTEALAGELKKANDLVLQASTARRRAEAVSLHQQGRIQNLERDIRALNQEITTKQGEIEIQKKEISEQKTQISMQREQIMTLNQSMETLRKRANQLRQIADVARAVAFELNVKLAELEDDYNHLRLEVDRHRETIARLESDITRYKAQLALCRENFPEAYKYITSTDPVPNVPPGKVAAIRVGPSGKQELVMLTVGSEAGVKVGMVFIVFRENHYICKVRVSKVLPKLAACLVIQESWNIEGLEMQQGDTAQVRVW